MQKLGLGKAFQDMYEAEEFVMRERHKWERDGNFKRYYCGLCSFKILQK